MCFLQMALVKHAAQSDATEFIIGTEKELCYRLHKENPSKKFYPVEEALCPNMKKITAEKVVKSLKDLSPTVTLPKDTRIKARHPLEKMLSIGRGD